MANEHKQDTVLPTTRCEKLFDRPLDDRLDGWPRVHSLGRIAQNGDLARVSTETVPGKSP